MTELYAEVQNFYAEQVRPQDHAVVDEFAATFTEDAVFQHTPGEDGVRGRSAIVAVARKFAAQPAAEESSDGIGSPCRPSGRSRTAMPWTPAIARSWWTRNRTAGR